jgi:protein brassinosteroid insensitive 2
MINGEPPFLGDSQIDQLIEIIKIMGTPLKHEVIDMNPEYNMTELSKFPNIKKTEWKNVFSIINSGSQNQRPSLSRLGP